MSRVPVLNPIGCNVGPRAHTGMSEERNKVPSHFRQGWFDPAAVGKGVPFDDGEPFTTPAPWVSVHHGVGDGHA